MTRAIFALAFAGVVAIAPSTISAATPARISGIVRTRDGSPAVGARVTLHTHEGDSVRTADARGFFVFLGVPTTGEAIVSFEPVDTMRGESLGCLTHLNLGEAEDIRVAATWLHWTWASRWQCTDPIYTDTTDRYAL
jgi:hypothetical protein